MPKPTTTKKNRTRKPPANAARDSRDNAPPAHPLVTAPRVTVGTALCHAGLDELALGQRWVDILGNLSDPKQRENTAIQKLLFDVLKECTRQLDSDHEQAGAGPNVVVRLVHAVPRPPRVLAALASANPPDAEAAPTGAP